jgi:hypothetical protein
MSSAENGESGAQFSSGPLIAGAAMVRTGTVLLLAGLAVGGGHLLLATRQWIREMEVPPSELAKLKWGQARAAVTAGTAAWQNGSRATPADVS